MKRLYHHAHRLQIEGSAPYLSKVDPLLKRRLEQTKTLVRYRALLQILPGGEELQLNTVTRELNFPQRLVHLLALHEVLEIRVQQLRRVQEDVLNQLCVPHEVALESARDEPDVGDDVSLRNALGLGLAVVVQNLLEQRREDLLELPDDVLGEDVLRQLRLVPLIYLNYLARELDREVFVLAEHVHKL